MAFNLGSLDGMGVDVIMNLRHFQTTNAFAKRTRVPGTGGFTLNDRHGTDCCGDTYVPVAPEPDKLWNKFRRLLFCRDREIKV